MFSIGILQWSANTVLLPNKTLHARVAGVFSTPKPGKVEKRRKKISSKQVNCSCGAKRRKSGDATLASYSNETRRWWRCSVLTSNLCLLTVTLPYIYRVGLIRATDADDNDYKNENGLQTTRLVINIVVPRQKRRSWKFYTKLVGSRPEFTHEANDSKAWPIKPDFAAARNCAIRTFSVTWLKLGTEISLANNANQKSELIYSVTELSRPKKETECDIN